MRVLLFVFIFSVSVFAQSPIVNQAFASGNDFAQERKYEQAIEKYQTAAMHAENERLNDAFLAKLHFNLGVCFYQLKQTNRAITEYQEAIKISRRGYHKAFYALGMAYKDLENWRESETALRNAVQSNKSDGEAWFDLALVYLETKNFAAAKKAFTNAVKYESVDLADAHNNLGVIAALNDDWNSAEREFETALKKSNGKNAEAKGNLRFCKFYKKEVKGKDWLAKLEFSQAVKRGRE